MLKLIITANEGAMETGRDFRTTSATEVAMCIAELESAKKTLVELYDSLSYSDLCPKSRATRLNEFT